MTGFKNDYIVQILRKLLIINAGVAAILNVATPVSIVRYGEIAYILVPFMFLSNLLFVFFDVPHHYIEYYRRHNLQLFVHKVLDSACFKFRFISCVVAGLWTTIGVLTNIDLPVLTQIMFVTVTIVGGIAWILCPTADLIYKWLLYNEVI